MRNPSVLDGSHGCVLLRRKSLLLDDFGRTNVHLFGVGLALLEGGVLVSESATDLLDLEASKALADKSEFGFLSLGLDLVFPFEFRSSEQGLLGFLVFGFAGFLFYPHLFVLSLLLSLFFLSLSLLLSLFCFSQGLLLSLFFFSNGLLSSSALFLDLLDGSLFFKEDLLLSCEHHLVESNLVHVGVKVSLAGSEADEEGAIAVVVAVVGHVQEVFDLSL